MADKDGTRWSYAAGLDEMCSPGCYLLQLRHNCPGTTLPLPACDEEHYITATLIVTESGTDDQLQRNRLIGQTLIMPDCNDGRTRIFNRTLRKRNSNRTWNNWNNIAQSSIDDEITNTEDLIASVTELKLQTKEIKTDLSSETARSKEAEAAITKDAILSGSLNINPDKERITLAYRNIDGTEVSAVDIPAASTEKAGVMSAEDKVKVNSSFDYVNTIEDKQFDVSSLSVGNAGNRDVGTTVSFGKLEDWRVGTFRCKAGQLIKINTQGGLEAARPFAFCDRDLVILQSFGYDVGDGINKGAYVAPEGTEYIVVNCTADYADKFLLEVWGKQTVPSSIDDRSYTASSLWVGNAGTRDVGTTVSFGKLEDWRVGTFRCKAGQLIKINTQGGIGAARPFAFCDKDLTILQTSGKDTGDGMLNGEFIAPGGTEYIVVNCMAEYTDNFLVEVKGNITDSVNRINQDALQADTIHITQGVDKVCICGKSLDGTNTMSVEFTPATTETAGVMSAEDKVKADSSFDYVNTIEDKHFDVSSLSVGNAGTRDIGTTVSFGKLEDWRVGTFQCKAGQLIKINTQGGLEAARPFAFCDRDLVILQSFGYDVGDGINKGAYVAPEGTEYIVVNCTADYADKFLLEVWGKQTVPSSIDDRSYTASSLWVGNAGTRDVGTTVSFGKLEDWRVGTFRCKAGQLIKINTQGGIGAARPFAFCDKDLTILQTSGKDTGDGMLNGEFIAPEGTEYIVVNCTDEYAGSFSLEIMGSIVYEMQNMDVAPQIYEQPIRRRGKDEPVRLCFFGNSWHMNTWWYLNKMLHSAGINAEMKCFYIGGSIFNKWVDNYKNNTAVDCWISVNGSNWEHDTLNFADTLKEKWDVIAFQQGAYKALDWNNWSIYNELLSFIKRNCGVDTVIAFNVGWTPALQNENLAVYGNTVEGQRIWQEIDNRYTLRFMKMSGISNVAPNGATMWSMRRNPKLNVANDMATDALHPDNGLPMYGLAGTWWQTYIAPMFGIDFSEVEWMPTESSQKAEWVSGTTWQPISEEQRELIREIVKLSMSGRFGFNEV